MAINFKDFDAACFTSNGVVTNSGKLVMGAGIAKFFRDLFPGIDAIFGKLVKEHGNRCFVVKFGNTQIINFPTKNDWRDDSNINLIATSCQQLMKIVDQNGFKRVFLPRPGCSNGHLSWDFVGPVVKSIVDDRVILP